MNRLQRLIRSRRMEKELDSELRFHLESQVADKMKAGASEVEARRSTRLEFGGLDQIKEDCRESRGTLWLASIAQDLSFGARILVRSPGFSATAILVLALGIGVNTLAFHLYDLLTLQSIPVRDPATLVAIERRSPANVAPSVPYASIAYYRENAKSLAAVMVTMSAPPMVLNHDQQRIHPNFVTANYFSELGASSASGRLFDPARENSTASAPVVVLSYRFWQRKFDGDPAIIGKALYVSGKAATVIGVTARTFANLGTENPDIWLPLLQHSYFVEGSKALNDPSSDQMLMMWGRLAPFVSYSQAEQELLALTNQLRKLYPAVIWDHESIVVKPGAHFLALSLQDQPPVLAFVGLLVLLILAVACANLGGLLMARGVDRRPEVQLRFNLGARRSRVLRQLLTESLLLGAFGSVAALPLSYIVLRLGLVYADAPAWMSALPDWRVLVFTAALGILAASFFGVLPTWQLVRRNKESTLWHQLVVGAQVGASCVLLILTGLLVRATLHTLYTHPGFSYEQVLSIDPALGDHGYTPSAAQAYLDQLQNRLRRVPGVLSVSMALSPPLVNTEVMLTGIHVDGHEVLIYPNWVGPEFFETMGIPLVRGRSMRPGETHAVVLSESLARKRWPGEDPIGKPWKDSKDIVVGVVGNTRAMELNNTDAMEVYFPPSADRFSGMSILVRTSGDPKPVSANIQMLAGSIDPKIISTITPLKAGFRKSVAQVEQIATFISILGGIAIFLAVIGLLGLVAYAVSQRTKEIAIRLAIGANRKQIVSAVMRRFVWSVLIGLAAGVGMTAALSQILRRGLYGISGLDPVSYLSATVLLIAILAVAALLPIRRAFRLNVARVLHSD